MVAPLLPQRYIPTLVGRLPRHISGKAHISGTSPRLWGDWADNRRFEPIWGYIPTLVGRLARRLSICRKRSVHPHACGEILSRSPFPAQIAVHPHACGEIGHAARKSKPTIGTSPRLWGDSSCSGAQTTTARYIPTLVGRFQ